ncbi:35851_t:CDS:2 [Racocetra persica]|uniref:35851_t:CDS:1 n=1 Tax=Racocetra persica TaxID=160502 RepID=A0ACA9LKW1_9GLOM|nr:35851_t:CDS:2 [Racocetra persica]
MPKTLLDIIRLFEKSRNEEDFLLLRNRKISDDEELSDILKCLLLMGLAYVRLPFTGYRYVSFIPMKHLDLTRELRPQKLAKSVHIFWPRPSNIIDYNSVDNSVNKCLAYKSMLKDNISPFVDLILSYHKSKSFREFKDYNEAALQMEIELLLPTKHRQPEVRLVVDGSKSSGASRFGFIDIFVSGWGKAQWVNKADYKSLKALDDKIEKEAKDELLNRRYFYWHKEKKLIQNGMEQLSRYMKTVQKGSVNKYDQSGIYDDKIEVMSTCGFTQF